MSAPTCIKHLMIACLLPVLFFETPNLLAASKDIAVKVSDISNEELPSVVIAYSLFCARYDEFKSLESNTQNALIKLRKNIDALPGGISTGLVFAHRAFILQNLEGRSEGFVRMKNKTLEESNIPFESILFVTTPIESFGNRVLLILSAVSPETTEIIAIDSKLRSELLYSSFNKNDIKNIKEVKGTPQVGSIFCIKVIKPGVFELQERLEPGGRGFASPYESRTFIVDVTTGKFEFSAASKE